MKKKAFFTMVAFSVLVSFGVAACTPASNQNSNSQQLEKIAIKTADNKTSATITKGQTLQLSASVEGVTWESSKPEVATIDANGLATSVDAGSTTITAKKDGFRDGTFTLRVELEKIVVTAGGPTELLIGETVTLTANKEGVTWESSNAEIASVTAAGVVTANKLGDVTISAKKSGFADGTQAIKVKRPAPTATLHFEDADHYSADGMWGTSYGSTIYGPGEESPVYTRSSGNASDGTCIAYMDNGDTEVLTFTSSANVKAELVMTMASRSAVSDMSSVMDVKFNNVAIDLAGKSFEGGGDTNTFLEFSLGEFNLQANNVLDFAFKASSPYFDDLNIYAESAANIAVVKPEAKPEVNVDKTEAEVAEGATVKINSTTEGVSYVSSNTGVAIVDDNGLVRGVSAGSANITVKKEGMTSAKVAITVTENANAIKVEAESGTSEESNPVTFRESQGAAGVTFTDSFPVGAVLTLIVNDVQAGDFLLTMAARGIRSGYSYSAVDLLTAMELKVNGVAVDLTGKQVSASSSIGIIYLGDVTLAATNTITIKALAEMPTIDYLRLVPKAA